MDCREFQDSITDYLDRVLAPDVVSRLEEHRLDCDKCETFLVQLRLTIDALGSLNKGKNEEELPSSLIDAFRKWNQSELDGSGLSEITELEELIQLSGEERTRFLAEHSGDELVHLGELAIDEVTGLSVRDPARAMIFAETAVEVLRSGIARKPESSQVCNDLLARAWSVLGNCRKICSDFPGAAFAFKEAEQELGRGSGREDLRAYLLQLRAQYFSDRGRLEMSLSDLDEAVGIYRSLGDSHNEGRTLIGKGKVLGSLGCSEQAIPVLRSGLRLIDPGQDLRLVLVGKHNLVQYLLECNCWSQAFELLAETRELHQALSNPVDLIRFRWLEGKIAMDLENLEGAEESFLEAKSYFVDQGMAYDAALVSLDLAMVYLKQTRITELKCLASEMVTIFRALGIPREVLAALAFFNKALEIEHSATVGLLQELTEVLEKTRQREECRPQLGVSN